MITSVASLGVWMSRDPSSYVVDRLKLGASNKSPQEDGTDLKDYLNCVKIALFELSSCWNRVRSKYLLYIMSSTKCIIAT